MDVVQCGHCQGTVEVPEQPGVAKCIACGSYVARKGVPLDTIRSFIWSQEGRADGKLLDVRQLDRWDRQAFNPVIKPSDVTRDSHEQFGPEPTRDMVPATFYAAWSAYDAAVENMPLSQRLLQEKAEILELERLLGL
jgi:hypothetical protein